MEALQADFCIHNFLMETESDGQEWLCLANNGEQLYFGAKADVPEYTCAPVSIQVDAHEAVYRAPTSFSWPNDWEELGFVKRMEKCQWIVSQGYTHVDYPDAGDEAIRQRVHAHHPLLVGSVDDCPMTFSLERDGETALVVIEGMIVFGRDVCKPSFKHFY